MLTRIRCFSSLDSSLFHAPRPPFSLYFLGTCLHAVFQVDITMLKDVTGEHLIQVPIDDSIQDFEVQLVGYMDSAVMKDITGKAFM